MTLEVKTSDTGQRTRYWNENASRPVKRSGSSEWLPSTATERHRKRHGLGVVKQLIDGRERDRLTPFVVGLDGEDAHHLREQVVRQQFQAEVVLERVGVGRGGAQRQFQQRLEPRRLHVVDVLGQFRAAQRQKVQDEVARVQQEVVFHRPADRYQLIFETDVPERVPHLSRPRRS